MPLAAAFPDFILGLHILGAIVGFGGLFVFPLLWSAAARVDPSVTPWVLRIRKHLGRWLINPGLTLVVAAGFYLAADEHFFSSFFVAWGIAVAIVLGAVEGSYMIPRAGRLAVLAERDLAAAEVPAGGVQAGAVRASAPWSPEFVAGARRFSQLGLLMATLVVITVFLMATHA
ncbi:MAG: hypothetical protein ACRDMJ_04470 [Solirubrobacteraceae bacterium]